MLSRLVVVAAVELCDEIGETVRDGLLGDAVVHGAQLSGETVAGVVAQAGPGRGLAGLREGVLDGLIGAAVLTVRKAT